MAKVLTLLLGMFCTAWAEGSHAEDIAYVNQFIDRNETSVMATLRIFEHERRKALVGVNREVVERVYSQENIGRQLLSVIRSDGA